MWSGLDDLTRIHILLAPVGGKKILLAICVFIQDVLRPVRASYMGRITVGDILPEMRDVTLSNF